MTRLGKGRTTRRCLNCNPESSGSSVVEALSVRGLGIAAIATQHQPPLPCCQKHCLHTEKPTSSTLARAMDLCGRGEGDVKHDGISNRHADMAPKERRMLSVVSLAAAK